MQVWDIMSCNILAFETLALFILFLLFLSCILLLICNIKYYIYLKATLNHVKSFKTRQRVLKNLIKSIKKWVITLRQTCETLLQFPSTFLYVEPCRASKFSVEPWNKSRTQWPEKNYFRDSPLYGCLRFLAYTST